MRLGVDTVLCTSDKVGELADVEGLARQIWQKAHPTHDHRQRTMDGVSTPRAAAYRSRRRCERRLQPASHREPIPPADDHGVGTGWFGQNAYPTP
jgi:hypothetical protein